MPSGAMMDENYLKIMHDMGGNDTGSAVPQLCMHMLGTNERDLLQHCDHALTPADTSEPTAPIWDCTEPAIDDDTHGTNADWTIAPMFQPTSPEWRSQWDPPVHTLEQAASPTLIQCPTTDSYAHNRLTTLLASIDILTLIACTLLLCAVVWMATQGYAITGLWLTITPIYDNGPRDQRGYQRLE